MGDVSTCSSLRTSLSSLMQIRAIRISAGNSKSSIVVPSMVTMVKESGLDLIVDMSL